MIPSRRRAKRRRPLGDLPRTCTKRDWTDLGDGPAGVIAELALATDVADYVRFRAVCRSWRRCSPDPRAGGLDGRFLPRRWIMIDKAPPRHRFLNLSTGEVIRMDLPELAEHKLLALTPECLLLLFHKPTLAVRLLNPLTRELTDLPPATALLTPEQRRHRPSGFETELNVSGVGLVAVDASTVSVVVSFRRPAVLAVAKPGDKSWTGVHYDEYMNSALPFAGRFYCATWWGVMVLDMGSESDQQRPRLQMVADRSESFYFIHMADTLHLVDNGGELMLVHRTMRRKDDEFRREYDAYKVDLEAGALVRGKGFNGCAVFLGMRRAVSVPAEAAFLSVTAETIYLGNECGSRTEAYNVADGSRCDRIMDSIVNCLRHCIQGVGKGLA